jgi:hypothetical protein
MDRKEFAAFVMAIRTYYPKENILPNEQAIELWYRELQDIPAAVAETALRKWVATNKWSPSIAEIREMTVNITEGDSLTWGEAWEQVVMAIRRYGSYNPRDALESLDPLTRRCVKHLGYHELCMSENPTADRANFRMIFETLSQRKKTEQQLALPLREIIETLRLDGPDNGFRRLE